MYFFQGDMFGAGTETSTHTILFAIMFLASDQFRELQTRIQAEIEAECGDDPPSLDHKLTLLSATVMEVQRLRPVTPQVWRWISIFLINLKHGIYVSDILQFSYRALKNQKNPHV